MLYFRKAFSLFSFTWVYTAQIYSTYIIISLMTVRYLVVRYPLRAAHTDSRTRAKVTCLSLLVWICLQFMLPTVLAFKGRWTHTLVLCSISDAEHVINSDR